MKDHVNFSNIITTTTTCEHVTVNRTTRNEGVGHDKIRPFLTFVPHFGFWIRRYVSRLWNNWSESIANRCRAEPLMPSRSPNDFATNIASGTQDLAALAGLFCTDLVEHNWLALEHGYGSSLISSLSLLGVLGLVKGAVKLCLGPSLCRNAGIQLDTLRGIIGYEEWESPSSGDLVPCYDTIVEYSKEEVKVVKKKVFRDTKTSPFLSVGSDMLGGLKKQTAVNLGNRRRQMEFKQGILAMMAFAATTSGLTAWVIMIVPTPWTWVRILATSVLHPCLFLLSMLPLLPEWQQRQPGRHINFEKWELLFSKDSTEDSNKSASLHFLQVPIMGESNVLHFQGDMTIYSSSLFRLGIFVLAAATGMGYICQYSLIQGANNKQALIWVLCQAVFALVRAIFWAVDPSFDDAKTQQSEYVVVNNRSSICPTPMEIIIVCEEGTTRFSCKVWQYLLSSSPKEIVMRALELHPPITNIPLEDHLLTLNFPAILLNRVTNFDGQCNWRLGLMNVHGSEGLTFRPFILVKVVYTTTGGILKDCWTEPIYVKRPLEHRHYAVDEQDNHPVITITRKSNMQSIDRSRESCDQCKSSDHIFHPSSIDLLIEVGSSIEKWVNTQMVNEQGDLDVAFIRRTAAPGTKTIGENKVAVSGDIYMEQHDIEKGKKDVSTYLQQSAGTFKQARQWGL